MARFGRLSKSGYRTDLETRDVAKARHAVRRETIRSEKQGQVLRITVLQISSGSNVGKTKRSRGTRRDAERQLQAVRLGPI
jgi:hypothetical protein